MPTLFQFFGHHCQIFISSNITNPTFCKYEKNFFQIHCFIKKICPQDILLQTDY